MKFGKNKRKDTSSDSDSSSHTDGSTDVKNDNNILDGYGTCDLSSSDNNNNDSTMKDIQDDDIDLNLDNSPSNIENIKLNIKPKNPIIHGDSQSVNSLTRHMVNELQIDKPNLSMMKKNEFCNQYYLLSDYYDILCSFHVCNEYFMKNLDDKSLRDMFGDTPKLDSIIQTFNIYFPKH